MRIGKQETECILSATFVKENWDPEMRNVREGRFLGELCLQQHESLQQGES